MKSSNLNRALILVISIISSFMAYGQGVDPNDLFFRYITVENGLPNNKVNAISMDKYGFMWFGTNDGICRYDGINIKYYAQDNLTGNRARTSQVSVIKNVSPGIILIGTYSLFRYNYERDTIIECDTAKGPDMTGRVYTIEEGSGGTVWLGCEKGLFTYNCLEDSIRAVPLRPGKEYSVFSLLFDNGKLWFGTRQDGIYIYDTVEKKCRPVTEFNLTSETKDQVNTLFRDQTNSIWAGTQDDGIFILNPADSSVKHIFPDAGNTQSYRIRKIISDKYGNIWIGSRLGIFFSRSGSDSLSLVKQVDPLPSTTRSNSIFDIFIDPNEVLWAGTFSFGVTYADFRRKPFRLYNLSDEETMFFAKNINCFSDCDRDNIWIGTEEGGLFKFNRHTRKFIEYKPEKGKANTLAGENVKALAREKSGNLWIGFYNSGVDYLNVSTGKITHFSAGDDLSNSISSNLIRTLLIDEDENLWIGTDKGIDLLAKGTRNFAHFNLNIEVLTIFRDRNNNIWAGTSGNGIYLFDKTKNKFFKKYPDYFTTTIKAIYVDTRNNLWVGTNKGLFHVDTENDLFSYTGIAQGLPSNAILDILEDNFSNLWVSTGAGLVKLRGAVRSPDSIKVLKFGSQDGLQGEQFREFASYKNKEGEFYFGGVQGFNIFSPDSIRSNPYHPRLAFTNLRIFNRAVGIGEKITGRIVLEKSINESKEITLSYKHSPVLIEFAALHYSDSKNNQFRYKLMPLEKDWNYSEGIMNFASYSNLRKGDFTFILEGANADGLWNPKPLTLHIKVIPPFWITWWFTFLVIILLSASAIGYYFYRISKLKRYNLELESKVDDRTRKLKESLDEVLKKQAYIEEQAHILNIQKDQLQTLNSTKDKFFSIIAHDLRSPFQALTGLSDLMVDQLKNSESGEMKTYASMIHESSHHIYDLVENLLSWSRTQRNKISFEPSAISLPVIIDDTLLLLQPGLQGKNITVEKHLTASRNGFCDRNMIEFIFRNLISNAIKFTHENGKIVIYLTDKASYLQCEICDNGIGISPEDQLKLFRIDSDYCNSGTNGEKGTGLGLIICKEFIEKNNGRLWVESKPGAGSSFFFTIPVATGQA